MSPTLAKRDTPTDRAVLWDRAKVTLKATMVGHKCLCHFLGFRFLDRTSVSHTYLNPHLRVFFLGTSTYDREIIKKFNIILRKQ